MPLTSNMHVPPNRQIDAVRLGSTWNLTPTSIAVTLTVVNIHCLFVAFSMRRQNAIPHRIKEYPDIFQSVYTPCRPTKAQEQATANAKRQNSRPPSHPWRRLHGCASAMTRHDSQSFPIWVRKYGRTSNLMPPYMA